MKNFFSKVFLNYQGKQFFKKCNYKLYGRLFGVSLGSICVKPFLTFPFNLFVKVGLRRCSALGHLVCEIQAVLIMKQIFLSPSLYVEGQFNLDTKPTFAKAVNFYWSKNKDGENMVSEDYSFSNIKKKQTGAL